METMTYATPDTLVVLDDTVIEVFRQLVTGSQRTPLVWAGASLKSKKGDEIQVQIGASPNSTDPFYGSARSAARAAGP